MTKVIMIAAIGPHRELGFQNQLLWHIPEDLQFFKRMTMNQIIVMGRKTLESLPRKLKNRHYVVFSHSSIDKDFLCVTSIDEIFHKFPNKDIYIIGGGQIYQLFLPYADEMYITHVKMNVLQCDTYFPKWNETDWESQTIDSFNEPLPYERVKYLRKRK